MTDTDMRVEAPTQVTPTQTPTGEQTTQKPEKELTPEEKFDLRLDEIIDPSIIFTDPNKAKNEIKALRDEYAAKKVDEALEQDRENNQFYIGGTEGITAKRLSRHDRQRREIEKLTGYEG